VFAAGNESVGEECRIVLRVGVHPDDVILEGDDIHGGGVNTHHVW
jgi:hypothetical protein